MIYFIWMCISSKSGYGHPKVCNKTFLVHSPFREINAVAQYICHCLSICHFVRCDNDFFDVFKYLRIIYKVLSY